MFSVQGEYQSLIRLMEVRKKLYPFEYEPYDILSSYYQRSIGIDTAIAIMQEAATLSNRERALGELFNLYKGNQSFSLAEEVLKDLEAEYPDPELNGRRYIELYRASGDLAKARAALKDMITLDPLNANLTFDLVKLEQSAGNYTEAEKQARKALSQAATYTDSTNMWNGIIQALASQGRITEALAELDGYEDHLKKVMPVNRIVMNDLGTRTNYLIMAGRFGELEAEIEKAGLYDQQYAALYRCYLPMQAIVQQQRLDNDQQTLQSCQDAYRQMGEGVVEIAKVAELLFAEDYERAAVVVEEQLAKNLTVVPYYLQARVFREAGKLDRATEIIDQQLASAPDEPLMLLEQVQVFLAEGKEEEARSSLQRVLATYAAADPDFIHRKRAEAISAGLGTAPN